MTTVKEKMYLNAFKLAFPYGNVVFRKILAYSEKLTATQNFSGLSYIWNRSSLSELQKIGLSNEQSSRIIEMRKMCDVEAEYALLLAKKVTLINRFDEGFPQVLKDIPDPPSLLYVQGDSSLLSSRGAMDWNAAIVGTRIPSPQGVEITNRIVKDLSNYRSTVVSGLAYGIDYAAHSASIQYGVPTIAVLGAGHESLERRSYDKVVQSLQSENVAISEFPYSAKGNKFTFPQRNRLISGLSLATIIVEAKEKSGAHITADFAADQGREIFAVPGSLLNECAVGTNKLIEANEARIFTNVEAMCAQLNMGGFSYRGERFVIEPVQNMTKLQKRIMKSLLFPLDAEQVADVVKRSVPEVLHALSQLELRGVVKSLPRSQWVASGSLL